jgi:hypothetical protein
MNRNIRISEWGESHPLARYLRDALMKHNGV